MFQLKSNNNMLTSMLKGIPIPVFLVFLCVFLFSSPSFAKTTEIKDVPPNHWAYQAVRQLVEEGYLGLYEDGSFKGDSPVNRYTLAMVVSKILVEVGEGTTVTNPQDVELIRKLSNEFRNELVLLTIEHKALEERLKKIEESKLILAEDQTQATSNIRMLSGEAKKLQAEVAKIAAEILQDKARITMLEEKYETQARLLEEQSQEIKALQEEVSNNRLYMILIGLAGILIGISI
ncbi:MAG TPA: S-layer homology domain-containing protein [Bacillota bacterium]